MDNKEKYWDGKKNKAVRYYYYTQKGLELFNEFRYLLMGIFAMYYTLRLDNIFLIPLMFLIALPILIFFGWLKIHHMSKIMEYLGVQFATHWGRYSYDLQEKRNQLLEELIKEVRDGNR